MLFKCPKCDNKIKPIMIKPIAFKMKGKKKEILITEDDIYFCNFDVNVTSKNLRPERDDLIMIISISDIEKIKLKKALMRYLNKKILDKI